MSEISHTNDVPSHDVHLSVVICTYNREALLDRLLDSLSGCESPPDRCEIIVVDNNSTDGTRSVVEKAMRRDARLRYVFEGSQGLSFARNAGWRHASGVYVAYLDDECTVPANWITVALSLIRDPAADVFGGPYFGDHLTTPPKWWRDTYESYTLSESARYLVDGEFIRGANLFIRRELLVDSGGFDVDLGMQGDAIAYGEESDWQYNYRKRTSVPSIYYDPSLYVYHLVRPEKSDLGYLLRSRFAGGRHIYSVFWSKSDESRGSSVIILCIRAVLTLARLVLGLSWHVFFRRRSQFPFIQNYVYERTFSLIEHLGFLYERARNP